MSLEDDLKYEVNDFTKTLYPDVLKLIQEKYQVCDIIAPNFYAHRIDQLIERLAKYQNFVFESNQRLIVIYQEIDYYPSLTSNGNMLFNLFRLLADFNVPCEKIVIITSHYGVEKEISTLARSMCNADSPLVICTGLWGGEYAPSDVLDFYAESPIADVPITSLYQCLNYRKRGHRLLTLCWLKELGLVDQGILSYHFKS